MKRKYSRVLRNPFAKASSQTRFFVLKGEGYENETHGIGNGMHFNACSGRPCGVLEQFVERSGVGKRLCKRVERLCEQCGQQRGKRIGECGERFCKQCICSGCSC